MHHQVITQFDPRVAPRPATEFVPDGLFSHPDTDLPSARNGSEPPARQRAYTGLFREPAFAPEHAVNAA
ncbi:hypothetical protein [Nocardia sp. NRRL S-836]|uniref:hypothetical protein n=1 Tax=Nocardia sp. NRRL S-836 TaxID=1519492 RepID=UPI0006AFD985|nr:hypothetical protein [Nocardia sp. NRRL S-836]KOV78209.1 hypothetical protein ADL03_40475 [Nocardia sp. NRRL S-836]